MMRHPYSAGFAFKKLLAGIRDRQKIPDIRFPTPRQASFHFKSFCPNHLEKRKSGLKISPLQTDSMTHRSGPVRTADNPVPVRTRRADAIMLMRPADGQAPCFIER